MKRAILIAGPTASGKSALAVRLARECNGVVINADSMQVYADLEILTARPNAADLTAVPHALYGYVRGDEPYSVGRWLMDAKRAIEEAWSTGRVPIVVGGTGLYFKALLEGLAPIPAVPSAIREAWREEARRLGAARLHALLKERDPATAAQLKPTDTQRLTRALEVLDASGRGLAEWQRVRPAAFLQPDTSLRLVIGIPRAELQARADRRFDAMMVAGALAEAQALAAKCYPQELPVMRALGVRPLVAASRGLASLEEAIEQAKLETRQYIKRQETWLRRHMITWNMVETKEMERISAEDFTFTPR